MHHGELLALKQPMTECQGGMQGKGVVQLTRCLPGKRQLTAQGREARLAKTGYRGQAIHRPAQQNHEQPLGWSTPSASVIAPGQSSRLHPPAR